MSERGKKVFLVGGSRPEYGLLKSHFIVFIKGNHFLFIK